MVRAAMGAGGISVRSGRYLLPLGLIVLAGAVLRLVQADQSLIADEMWSYVGATQPDVGAVFDYVRSDQEITPPLFTLLAWLAGRLSDAAAVLRIPSLAAGILTVPLVYAIGKQAVNRNVGLLAALLTALSPFLIWQSVELRAYSVVAMLVAASTLSLMLAIDRRGWGWWIAYAAFSCAAMYTHYTAVYVLAAQAIWALAAHRDLILRVLVANAAAAVLYIPWLPALRDDLNAPSQAAIENLAPFNAHNVIDFTGRFLFGSPSNGLEDFYGPVLVIGLVLGLFIALGGLAARVASDHADAFGSELWRKKLTLVVAAALAAPMGVALVSLLGSDQYLSRNLAASAPAALVVLSALLLAGPKWSRMCSTVLVVVVFAFGAIRTTEASNQRIAYGEAAALIDETAGTGDAVLDVGLFNPGSPPAFALDINFADRHQAFDFSNPGAPEAALRAARGHRLYLVGPAQLVAIAEDGLGLNEGAASSEQVFPGILPLTVATFEIPES